MKTLEDDTGETLQAKTADGPAAYEIAARTSETTAILTHEHNHSKRSPSLFSRICCCVPIKFT